jgi:hypothetical protein
MSFGTDAVGLTTVGQMVLVSNSGGTNLTVGQIGLSGTAQADYAYTGTCYAGLVLTPGASCFLQVNFDPTAPGARSAVLQIGSASIALSGTGAEGVSSDGPLPLWAYALMGALILAIGTVRQRKELG